MNALSPAHFTIAKAPPRKGCDFPIFACNLSRLEPRLAMQAELKLAAMMRETAKIECRRAGMVPGRLPESKHEMQGKLSNAKPRPDRDASVLACLSAEPISAWRIQQRTGFGKSSVACALVALREAGKAICKPGTARTAAEWWLA